MPVSKQSSRKETKVTQVQYVMTTKKGEDS